MALNPSTCAESISLFYQNVAGIDADGNPAPTLPADYPANFASAYDDYAAEGVVLGALNDGRSPEILENFMRTATGNDAQVITDFATALAEYWATVAVQPGLPAHGGSVVESVSNDAMAHIADFEAAILASMTSVESKPWFNQFVTNVENIAVSAIIWTVIEVLPPSTPTPFTEVIT